MKKRMSRKSARGGQALLTGLVRCGRCGRMMRVFYGTRSGHAHRYQCPGDSALAGTAFCIGIGGSSRGSGCGRSDDGGRLGACRRGGNPRR